MRRVVAVVSYLAGVVACSSFAGEAATDVTADGGPLPTGEAGIDAAVDGPVAVDVDGGGQEQPPGKFIKVIDTTRLVLAVYGSGHDFFYSEDGGPITELAGTSLASTVFTPGPTTADGLATDDMYLYWTDTPHQALWRVSFQSGVAPSKAIDFVAANAGVVHLRSIAVAKGGSGSLVAFPVESDAHGPVAARVDIYSFPANTVAASPLAQTMASIKGVVAIAANSGGVVWGEKDNASEIVRAPIVSASLGPATPLKQNEIDIRSVALGASFVVWATGFEGAVRRLPLSGGTVQDLFPTNPPTAAIAHEQVFSVVVASAQTYWVTDKGNVYSRQDGAVSEKLLATVPTPDSDFKKQILAANDDALVVISLRPDGLPGSRLTFIQR